MTILQRVAALACVAALAACGGEGSTAGSSASGSSTQGAQPSSSLSPASSTSSSPDISPSSSPSVPPSPDSTSPATPSAPPPSIEKHLGDVAEIVKRSTNTAVVQFAITGVHQASECTAFDGTVLKPSKGVFYYIDITGSMTKDSGLEFIVTDVDTLAAFGANGKKLTTAPSKASDVCLDVDKRFPPSLVPGDKATGTLILDAPPGLEKVGWFPHGPTARGWEWSVK